MQHETSLVGEVNVLNFDQSSFNQEMHTRRTLSFKGPATVEALAQSINSLTQSYTIQPLITVSGVLLLPLLIVLQEEDEKFGPRVQQNLFKSDNVLVLDSKSGKLTSDLVRIWFQKVFIPSTCEKIILLLDSYSGQNEKNI